MLTSASPQPEMWCVYFLLSHHYLWVIQASKKCEWSNSSKRSIFYINFKNKIPKHKFLSFTTSHLWQQQLSTSPCSDALHFLFLFLFNDQYRLEIARNGGEVMSCENALNNSNQFSCKFVIMFRCITQTWECVSLCVCPCVFE